MLRRTIDRLEKEVDALKGTRTLLGEEIVRLGMANEKHERKLAMWPNSLVEAHAMLDRYRRIVPDLAVTISNLSQKVRSEYCELRASANIVGNEEIRQRAITDLSNNVGLEISLNNTVTERVMGFHTSLLEDPEADSSKIRSGSWLKMEIKRSTPTKFCPNDDASQCTEVHFYQMGSKYRGNSHTHLFDIRHRYSDPQVLEYLSKTRPSGASIGMDSAAQGDSEEHDSQWKVEIASENTEGGDEATITRYTMDRGDSEAGRTLPEA